jgi:hypothetical protein
MRASFVGNVQNQFILGLAEIPTGPEQGYKKGKAQKRDKNHTGTLILL